MDSAILIRFLEKASTDPQLARELSELAAKHGFDLCAGELGDAQLDDVAGGRPLTPTPFQNFDQKTNQLMNMLASVVKTMNETRTATIRNIL